MVDTDVFSYVHYQKGPWEEFQRLLVGHPLALSFATVAELRAGAIKRSWGSQRMRNQERFVSAYTIVRPNTKTVDEYAAIHAQLHWKLKGGGVNDMWTAACALTYGLPIVTNNRSDFDLIRSVESRLLVIHPALEDL